MKSIFIYMIILILVMLPVTAYAQEPIVGTINGQVFNETEDGGDVAGVEVTLVTYVDDIMAETKTIHADSQGKFQFKNVDTENSYLVYVRYMKVDYYYEVTFEPEVSTADMEIWVCDATDSNSAIKTSLRHTVMEIEEDEINVTELYYLVNDSDKTYVGINNMLVFTLPDEVSTVLVPEEMSDDYQLLDNDGIAYLVPFPPGERQLMYNYTIEKPQADDLSILLKIDYLTDKYEIMVAGEDIEVVVSELAPAEPITTDSDTRYIHFHGENLARGTMINLNLSGLAAGSSFPFVVLWVILAIAVIAIVVYFFIIKRRVIRSV